MDDEVAHLPHHFPGAPETSTLYDELEAQGSALSMRAASALRIMDARMADLQETLSFTAENGGHFLVLTNSEEHMEMVSKYQKLLQRVRAAPELEIDDGQAVFRAGPVSITVSAETAVVFNAEKEVPARRVALSHDRFFDDAEDFFRKD